MPSEQSETPSSIEHGLERVWGSLARLGLIVPTTNTVNEAEWAAMAPEGVTIHSARMSMHHFAEGESVNRLPTSIAEAIAQLTPAGVNCIAYGCTAGSMITPVEALPELMAETAGTPCTSTAAAMISALQHLKVSTVTIATPYIESLNAQNKAFFENHDIAVADIQGLGIGAGGAHEYSQLSRLPLERVKSHAIDTFRGAPAEALLLACTDMPSLPLLNELENTLGVPVISANTATLWDTLRRIGVKSLPGKAGALSDC